MDKIKVITTREDAHSVRAEVVGHPEAGIHRGKKETIAIAKIAEHNKPLFNIHKEGEHDAGLKIIKHQIGKLSYAFVQDDTEIKPEHADSFEEALGKIIKHHKEKFNIKDIHHKER
jgi:hypothetical protein